MSRTSCSLNHSGTRNPRPVWLYMAIVTRYRFGLYYCSICVDIRIYYRVGKLIRYPFRWWLNDDKGIRYALL